MAMAEMPGPYDVRSYECLARGVITNTCTDGALSRRVAAGDHLHARAADGQGRRGLRHRSGRYPPPQPDRQISLQVGDRASYSTTPPTRRRWRWRSKADRRAGLPQAPARGARATAAISASALRPSPSAPATAARPLRRAAWRSRPGWETVDLTVDPSGFVEARIGASPHGQGLRTTLAQIIADELGITPEHDQGRAWRHRPRALRLGHLRQPLAGDFRRRHADCRAEGARQAASRSRATCSKRRRTTSCWQTAWRKVAGTDRDDPDRKAGARGLSRRRIVSKARSSPA